jgi:hypothetical protein
MLIYLKIEIPLWNRQNYLIIVSQIFNHHKIRHWINHFCVFIKGKISSITFLY